MMKRKLLFSIVALLCSVGAWAQYSTANLISDGWSQVTSSSITETGNNYYVLVDAKSSTYVMASDATHYRPCYKSIARPADNPSFVWILEGSENTFNLKNYATGAYFKQSSGWNTSVGDGKNGSTASLIFTYSDSDSKYSIQCSGQGLVGHWNDNGNGVAGDGENIAANKAAKDAPGFYLYAISRASYDADILSARESDASGATAADPVDVTAWIQNADWSGDWGGWEFTCTESGNIQWGEKTLESWNAKNVTIKQELRSVPNGKYRVSADLISGNNDNKVAYVFGTGDAKVCSDAVTAVASVDNYNKMSEEVSGKTLTADNIIVTGNTITIGVDQTAGWIVADNFKLYYLGNSLSVVYEPEAFSSGSGATADTWYEFTVPSDGWYSITSSVTGTITYTQDGSHPFDFEFSLPHFNTTTNKYLKAGSFYFKTSTDATVTIASTSVEVNGDFTSLIANPSFEEGDMSGWETICGNKMVDPTKLSDCGVKTVASYLLSNSDGDYIMNYYGWSWSYDPVNGIQQTIYLPAGKYHVEAVLGGWENWNMVLQVNYGDDQSVTKRMDGINSDTGVPISLDVTLENNTDFTITAKTYYTTNLWRDCFMKADNFRLYNYFDLLNAAIAEAETHTLGFESGEYAPYNNTDAIAALNAAKAVDQDNYDITWSELQTIVSNLTSATWTANVSEVNAFYDGTFETKEAQEESQNNTKLEGWTSGNNFRQILKTKATFAGLDDATDGTAIFSWASGGSYGSESGYTMPLKANTIYKLKLKTAGWNNEDRSNIKVSVLKATEGMATYNLGTPTKYITTGLDSHEVLFATGTAGNYIFTISCDDGKNFVFTDLEIKKAPNQYLEFADGSVPTYAPGTYPSVKITRTLTAGRWATAVYPFAVSGVDDIAVLDSYNKTTGVLTFSSAAASTANEPFFMRSTTAKSEISLSNVAVSATTANPTVTKSEASLIGAYTSTDITNAAKNFVLSNNYIYNVAEAGATIKPYRAYIQIAQDAPARELSFVVDDEITAIEGFSTEQNRMPANVYNLNGQLVKKNVTNLNGLKKGIYIVEGKRIVVK